MVCESVLKNVWRIMQSYKQATDHLFVVMLTKFRRIIMWTTPAATEMRFGFEVTMYVMNK
jgi:coenzyme PQQ precursor peptide PqqA